MFSCGARVGVASTDVVAGDDDGAKKNISSSECRKSKTAPLAHDKTGTLQLPSVHGHTTPPPTNTAAKLLLACEDAFQEFVDVAAHLSVGGLLESQNKEDQSSNPWPEAQARAGSHSSSGGRRHACSKHYRCKYIPERFDYLTPTNAIALSRPTRCHLYEGR